MDKAIGRFIDTFGPEALTDLVFQWLPGLIAAVVTILIFWMIYRVSRTFMTRLFERVDLDPTAEAFVTTLVQAAVVLVGLLTALSQMGVDTTSILTSLGVVGLTLGFAAQNTLSNVISGLFIFWDRPFVINDLVEVDGEYGRVATITLRSTRLVTVDGRMIAIPNAVIANSKVASYTNFPHLRIDIPVTIGVNEPVGKTREILLGLVSDGARYMQDPPPNVVVKTLGDYFVEVELRVWLSDESRHISERFRLREAVKDALDQAKVEMPFETFALTPVTVTQEAQKAS